MQSLRKLRIGITVGLHDAAETLWNNGIKQNAVFLADALRRCPNVGSVALLNTTNVPVTSDLPWDLSQWPTGTLDDAKDELDVLFELGGQIDAGQTDYLKTRGTRLVSYCCTVEYVMVLEAVLFGRRMAGENLFINQRYDAVWIIPQAVNISQPYFEVLRRCAGRAVPFVWSPVFLEQRVADLPDQGQYRPTGQPRRLVVMEPNINVVKCCLYPAMIAELAYRQRPDDIALLSVTNALSLARENADFIAVMNYLDIVRNHKAVFLGRYETPGFLSEHADIVVSHQWENPLNYIYLETCWQGYPLVHNASLCMDLGYSYPGNDLRAGAQRVVEIIDRHDGQYDAYREHQRALVSRYLPGNPKLVAIYSGLLEELMEKPLR